MSLRLFTRLLAPVFILVCCGSAFALEPNVVPANVRHVHQLMQKLGTGENALVAVRLKNKTAASGYVEEAAADHMLLVMYGPPSVCKREHAGTKRSLRKCIRPLGGAVAPGA